jgi:hypothetical protein
VNVNKASKSCERKGTDADGNGRRRERLWRRRARSFCSELHNSSGTAEKSGSSGFIRFNGLRKKKGVIGEKRNTGFWYLFSKIGWTSARELFWRNGQTALVQASMLCCRPYYGDDIQDIRM